MPLFQPVTVTVTELTRYLRQLLESDDNLQDIWVQGEVSNLSRPSSGHLYFTLKDSGASLRCVMWRNAVISQGILPSDGDQIEAHGAVSIYEPGGQYQLYIDKIRSLGEGLLYQEFLRLKTRLEEEGLFDPERKRAIPGWPQRIGIVTSPTGAALRDILNTLQRRYPLVEVILSPTAVQGNEAPAGIVSALKALNLYAEPDLILLARGGGSIEDLWAFNDERVAYAIADSRAPIISGVGHETDFTIADFAADLRAPTPTAAAELATPHKADLEQKINEMVLSLGKASSMQIINLRWALSELKNQLTLYSPRNRLLSDRQRLDEMMHSASKALTNRLQLEVTRLNSLTNQLSVLNPIAVLERGYAIVTDQAGELVRSVKQVTYHEELKVRVRDGEFDVRVEDNPDGNK
jgi:exodeoxyribonuclease VII large subunit